MTRAVTRLYDNRNDALEAAHELERMGIKSDDISVIASNNRRIGLRALSNRAERLRLAYADQPAGE